MQVQVLPPQLEEGQANWRWQPFRKRPSDEPWGFNSLPFRIVGCVQRTNARMREEGLRELVRCTPPTRNRQDVPLAERQRFQPSKLARWVRLPQGTLNTIGDRLTVGCLALTQEKKVRILLPELLRGVSSHWSVVDEPELLQGRLVAGLRTLNPATDVRAVPLELEIADCER